MSTNYYVRANYCTSCDRCDKIHIGSKSYGWVFSFHAAVLEDGTILNSYDKWTEFLPKYSDLIINEYGDSITLEDFHSMVLESLDEEKNQYDYLMKTGQYTPLDSKDSKGFPFYKGEFS